MPMPINFITIQL